MIYRNGHPKRYTRKETIIGYGFGAIFCLILAIGMLVMYSEKKESGNLIAAIVLSVLVILFLIGVGVNVKKEYFDSKK